MSSVVQCGAVLFGRIWRVVPRSAGGAGQEGLPGWGSMQCSAVQSRAEQSRTGSGAQANTTIDVTSRASNWACLLARNAAGIGALHRKVGRQVDMQMVPSDVDSWRGWLL